MMETKMDALLARFHSLPDNSVQETKRNFNELIEAIRQDVPLETDLDSLIASIQPKTKFEKVLKVELVIRFKRYDAMLDVLKSGNPMLIAKVLKCWELFEVAFEEIDERVLVDQIFPQTSSSTRLKIITRLSTSLKKEERADDFFNAIEGKYGLFVAKGLLPACSLALIKSIVANHKLILTSRQLLRVFKKDREFLKYYFGVLLQAHGDNFDFSGKYPQVLRHVAKVDGQLFWELFKKHHLKSKFGRHMTPRLYQGGKEIATRSDYNQLLFNLKTIHKILRGHPNDLRSLFLKLLPKNVDDFAAEYSSCCLKTLFGCIPRNTRYKILNASFEKAYGKSIHVLLSVDTPSEILEVMPVEKREIIADKKTQKNDDFIYLYAPSKAIPLLQERIKLMSNIDKRSSLVVQLCKTCLISRDSESLLKILMYMTSRHRNDDVPLSDFMLCLQEWPKLEKLSAEHWAYINDLLNTCKRMSNFKLYYHDVVFMMNYVFHLEENKMPYEEYIETFLKHIKDNKMSNFNVFLISKLPDYKKMCYEHFARLLPKIHIGDKFDTFACSLLAFLVFYNNTNPKRKITISQYPYLLEALKVEITKEEFYCADVILEYYLKFEDDGRRDQLFWDNYQKTCNGYMVDWYLRKRPHKILENLDKILTPSIITNISYRLPKILSTAPMLPRIAEQIISFSLNALHDDDVAVSKFAAMSLSYLSTTESYLEAAKAFLPNADGQSVKENRVSTQNALVKGLCNLDDPSSCLPILMEFCVDDSIKYASKFLYHLLSHTPEVKLESFLNSLYNSTVSVRKHVINITTRVCPKMVVYNFLKNCGRNERHPSLRMVVFKSTLWYFTANPSEEFWGLLKDNVGIIDENDKETLASLADLRKIPDGYQSEYITMAYTILSSSKDNETQAKKYILLSSVRNETVDKLSVATLASVIKDTFPGAIQKTDFYLKCLFYTTGSNQSLVLDLVLDILKDYVRDNYTVSKNRAFLYNIIRVICLKAVALKLGKDLIVKFMEFCNCSLKQGQFPEEYLLLQLTNAYLCFCSEAKLQKYILEVSNIFKEFAALYGPSMTGIFTQQLSELLAKIPEISSNEDKHFEFIDGLLSVNDADFNYILALNLMFDRVPWNDIRIQYGSILTKLSECKSSAVQVYFYRRLRKIQDKEID